ncbi:MAG TPA: helical backbone metal receptor [Kofleriaceae bacterium]
MRWLLTITVAACQQASAPTPTSSSANETPRIITLSPSATEIVAALGADNELVGVDDYSDYPPNVTSLPHVGSFMTPNLEVIVQLRPTLVIVDDIHSQVAGALHDAKVATLECAMHTVADVKACLKSVGDAIHKDSKKPIETIDHAIDHVEKPAQHPKVLLVIDREQGGVNSLVAAGPGTFNDELLALVGGDNVLAGASVKYPKIGTEEVLRAQPDVILDLSYAGRDSMKAWDGLAVPAVAHHKVQLLTSSLLAHPSPRIPEALDLLARSIK